MTRVGTMSEAIAVANLALIRHAWVAASLAADEAMIGMRKATRLSRLGACCGPVAISLQPLTID